MLGGVMAEQAPRSVTLFDGPTLVRWQEATRFLWGDAESGEVNDLIYGRNSRIGCTVFSLAPGRSFRLSGDWKPFFDQHRFYYVVEGALAIQDPETGDVAVAEAGEAVHWRGARWHFGYNFGDREVVVLDWYAPQERPLDVSEIAFGRTKPGLGAVNGMRGDLRGAWPASKAASRAAALGEGRVVRLTRADALNAVHGRRNPVLLRYFVTTPELAAGIVELAPSQCSDTIDDDGEKVIYVLEGRVHVHLPETFDWFELFERDVLYLPPATGHRIWNYGGSRAALAFETVPG